MTDHGNYSPKIGLGFRFPLSAQIEDNLDKIDVLELIVDQYFAAPTEQKRLVENIAEERPFVGHGVGLSLGTAVSPDPTYLEQVNTVIERLNLPYYSEHLAFTRVPGIELAELLPLPRNKSTAEIIIENIKVVQNSISVPFYIENIAYYFDYPQSDMTEAEFINLVSRESGAALLLDVENLYVNSINHSYDALAFLDALEVRSVRALHLAGGEQIDGVLIDDHGHRVPDAVLRLTTKVLERCNPDTIILERDRQLDRFEDMLDDLARIRDIVSPQPDPVLVA